MKVIVPLTGRVQFMPTTEQEEIIQNVRTLVSTHLGNVPLDRDLGLTWEHIDKPIQVAKSYLLAEVVELVKRYEPRAQVKRILFEENDSFEGELSMKIEIVIGEDDG